MAKTKTTLQKELEALEKEDTSNFRTRQLQNHEAMIHNLKLQIKLETLGKAKEQSENTSENQ